MLIWVFRLLVWLVPLPLMVWAASDPRFRDAEGFVDTPFCLPLACSIACLPLGWAFDQRWRPFCLWVTLALLSQAAALQLIDAGSRIHYQHYLGWDELLGGTHRLLLALLGLQAVCVVLGIWGRRPAISSWLRLNFRPWGLVAIGAVFGLSAAAVSRDVPFYVAELVWAAFLQTVNLGNIVLVAWSFPSEVLPNWKARWDRLFGSARWQGFGIDRVALWAAAWVLVCAALLSTVSYQRFPHLADEVVALYQARYFAEGMLTMPAPAVPEAFDMDLMVYKENRWYCPVPPGWPALLSVGVRLGAPWLVNPCLAAMNLLLVSILFEALYDRRVARLAVLLLAISPWHLFMAMNFLPHTSLLTCALIAAVAVTQARKTQRVLWGWVAGLALGFGSWIRPLDALVAGVLMALWSLGWGGRRLKPAALAGLVLATAGSGAGQLYYNQLLTGSATSFPIQAYTDKYYGPGSNAIGFGPERGLPWPLDPYPGHSPRDAVVNANLNLFSVNVELFGWSIGSLLVVALLLFGRDGRGADFGMVFTIVAVIGALSFYWFSGGPDFGARYWYLAIVPLTALTARGIEFLKELLERSGPQGAPNGTRIHLAVVILCGLTLVNYLPWRAIDKYFHYLGMRPEIGRLAQEYDFRESLVFVRGDRFPDYMAAALYNPIDLGSASTLYVWDRGPALRAQLREAYPRRRVWVVNGPTITGRGFRVVQRPTFRPSKDMRRVESKAATTSRNH